MSSPAERFIAEAKLLVAKGYTKRKTVEFLKDSVDFPPSKDMAKMVIGAVIDGRL